MGFIFWCYPALIGHFAPWKLDPTFIVCNLDHISLFPLYLLISYVCIIYAYSWSLRDIWVCHLENWDGVISWKFYSWRFVADLIHFGAVYYALVCPEPPPTATPEQICVYKEVTAPSVLQKRASIKGKTVREAQKTFRITHVNEFVEAGTYLRVHVHPKRFPR